MIEVAQTGSPNELPPLRTLGQWVLTGVCSLGYGERIDYAQLTTILGIDAQTRRGRGAILWARKRLLADHNKFLACVRGKGYEILKPEEHRDQAKRYRLAGARRLRKGYAVCIHVEINALDEKQRESHLVEQARLGLVVQFSTLIGGKRSLQELQAVALPSPRDIAKAITAESEAV